MKSLISKKRLRKERKKEERRTKQSLHLPQMIEANKNSVEKKYYHGSFA